jgi:hypothetical protein
MVGKATIFDKFRQDRRILEIASLDDYFGSKILLILAINKSSIMVDPISWPSLMSKLREAGERLDYKLKISDSTSSLFNERNLPRHAARVRRVRESIESSSLYAFFEPHTNWTCKIPSAIPMKSARLLHRIHQFDQKLLLIGILPNQLRSLAKEHKMNDVEESLGHLSDTLFWEGYELWKKRKLLVTKYWQTIAPKEWKAGFKEKKSRSKRKFYANCKNPFHYCERLHDLSKSRRTPCACSDVKKKSRSVNLPDIRCFIQQYPKRISSVSEIASMATVWAVSNMTSKIIEAPSRDDLIRKQHDRGKRKRDVK